MARYLLIDVRYCARSRKHILSKRKHVHSFWNRTFTATNRCNLWQNWHPYQGLNHPSLWEQVSIRSFLPINARQFYTAAPCHCLDSWDSEERPTSTQSFRSKHWLAIHSQGVELSNFIVSTWYSVIFLSVSHMPQLPLDLNYPEIPNSSFKLICELGKYCFSNFVLWITTTSSYPKLSDN